MTDPIARLAEDRWGPRVMDYEAMFAGFSSAVGGCVLQELDRAGHGSCKGKSFLDIGAGTGVLTLELAAAGARVVAVDLSSGMLEVLRDKLDDNALVESLAMDGTDLDFGDETFDLAGSNLGIVTFADPTKGLREMFRVLRRGGVAVVTAIAEPQQSPLMQTMLQALFTVGHPEKPRAEPASDPFSEAVGLADAMAQAGFRGTRVVTRTLPWVIEDAREFWHRWGTTAPPVAALFESFPPDVLAAAGVEFDRLVDEVRAGREHAVFDTEVLIAIGTR